MGRILQLLLGIGAVVAFGYQLLTGPKGGTYYRFGEDLNRFVATPIGIQLQVVPTDGSIQNLKLLAQDPSYQFGILQQDVMDEVKRSPIPKIRQRGKAVKLLLPLYLEEAHLIVRKGSPYRQFEELAGKRFGVIGGSGSSLTSALLSKYILQNPPSLMVKVDSFQQGLQLLRNGQIEWLLLVCGAPCKQIQQLDPNSFRLIGFDPHRPYLSYENTTIPPSAYPNLLQKPLPTIGVRSLLVIRNSSDPQLASDVRKLAIQLYKSRQLLQQEGHPKWRDVPFQLFPVAGWSYYKPFKEGWEIGKEVSKGGSGGSCTPEQLMLGRCK